MYGFQGCGATLLMLLWDVTIHTKYPKQLVPSTMVGSTSMQALTFRTGAVLGLPGPEAWDAQTLRGRNVKG